jgi:hypothetical protein
MTRTHGDLSDPALLLDYLRNTGTVSRSRPT